MNVPDDSARKAPIAPPTTQFLLFESKISKYFCVFSLISFYSIDTPLVFVGHRRLPDRERRPAAVTEANAASPRPSWHQATRLPQLRPRGSQVGCFPLLSWFIGRI